MQAFVTGATGLLGSNLARLLLKQGHHVRALARSTDKARLQFEDLDAASRARLEVVEGDMLDVAAFAPALDGRDALFHTAAYFREYYQPGDHWARLEAINVHATARLLEAAVRHGVTRVVHVSTSGVIGTGAAGAPGDERTPPTDGQLKNLYFRSKRAADVMIDELEGKGTVEVVTVHPGWMFGPGDAAPTSAGALVLQFLGRELPGVPAGGMNVADARDVAAAMVTAMERATAGSHYVLSGPFASMAEIFAALERVSGMPAPRRQLPPWLIEAVAWLEEALARIRRRPATLSLAGIRMLHLRMQVSSALAQRELGATFRPLDETLRDTVEWFAARGMTRTARAA